MQDWKRIPRGFQAEHGPDKGHCTPSVVVAFPLELTNEFSHRSWMLRPMAFSNSSIIEFNHTRGMYSAWLLGQ